MLIGLLQQHVPFRNSKLTQILQFSLTNKAKTLMFTQISPEEESASESLSTLNFASRVATVCLGNSTNNSSSEGTGAIPSKGGEGGKSI